MLLNFEFYLVPFSLILVLQVVFYCVISWKLKKISKGIWISAWLHAPKLEGVVVNFLIFFFR